MIEPQKKVGWLFLGFTPPKQTFFPAGGLMSELRRNVRIEEKRGNFNTIISNDQWPTGDYAMSERRKCRNRGEERTLLFTLTVMWWYSMLVQSTLTQYKLYYNANYFSDEMCTLPGKGINVQSCQPQRLWWCIWSASTSRTHLLQHLQESVSHPLPLLDCDLTSLV